MYIENSLCYFRSANFQMWETQKTISEWQTEAVSWPEYRRGNTDSLSYTNMNGNEQLIYIFCPYSLLRWNTVCVNNI